MHARLCVIIQFHTDLLPLLQHFHPTENTNHDTAPIKTDEKLKMEKQLEGIGNSTIEVSNDLMNLSKQLDNIREQHQQGLFHYRPNMCIGSFLKLISCTLICCLLTVITPIFQIFYLSSCTLTLNNVDLQ